MSKSGVGGAMKTRMDYNLAVAIGWDEGNRSMSAGGRTKWNKADQRAAWAAMEEEYPTEQRMADQAARCSTPGEHCSYCHCNVTLGEEHHYDCPARSAS